MTRIQKLASAAMVAASLGAGAVQAQQTPAPSAGADQPIISIIGCVERVMPAQTPPGTPAPPPTYKIIDVQPGNAVKQKPMTFAAEYFVVGPQSIAFSTFQNQWVEVTGRIFVASASTAVPPVAAGGKTSPPATFTVSTIKVVSTECKQGR